MRAVFRFVTKRWRDSHNSSAVMGKVDMYSQLLYLVATQHPSQEQPLRRPTARAGAGW